MDGKGNVVSGIGMSSAKLLEEENSSQFDINNDGKTGRQFSGGGVSKKIGEVEVGETQLGYAYRKGVGEAVEVKLSGEYISTNYAWEIKAVREFVDGAAVYRAYLKNKSSNDYAIWGLDGKGNVVSGAGLTVAQLLQEEKDSQFDINNDGAIGQTVSSSISYTLAGSQENLILIGNANINGTGNGLINIVIGNVANNILDGKAGTDTLTGLGGADSFQFSTAQPFGELSADHITDFNQVQGDTLRISKSAFGMAFDTAVTLATATNGLELTTVLASTSTFVYDSSNGRLYWNQNGNAAGFGTGGVFAVLDNTAALNAAAISLF